jgi:ABC-2 type transport system permease protein
VTLLVLIVGLYPGILFVYGDPELGKTSAGLLGVLLVGWTYVAIGCFASSLTRSQVLAFLITFVILLCMMLVPAIADLGIAGDAPGLAEGLRWLSTGKHFEDLVKGLVDTADLAYFAVVIGSFLLMTKAVVESVRWR